MADIVMGIGVDANKLRRRFKLASLLVEIGLAREVSQARDWIQGGSVEIDGEKITQLMVHIKDGAIIAAGRRPRRAVRVANQDK